MQLGDAVGPAATAPSDLRALTARFATVGRVEAIVLRPRRGVAAQSVPGAEAVAGRGLLGDRTAARAPSQPGGGKRQITLIQAEHLPLIARWAAQGAIEATSLRRNIVVSGLNLLSARSPFADRPLRVRLGEQVVLEFTGPCDPCSKMEATLGHGGYNAMRGHGGVTARVLNGGWVAVGDRIVVDSDTVG